MYSKNNSSFDEIKSSLNKVYDRIRIPQTKEKGHELFKKIISKNISNKTLLSSLINDIHEKLSKLSQIEKPPYIKLLSLFFFNQNQEESLKLYFPYLSPILSILQSLIIDTNNEIFSEISEAFAEIVQYLMPNDIGASEKILDAEEKESYETLQSFCIINIKIEQKINRIIGSLCLTKLVENCPFVLKNQYMKYILDNIIVNLSKENFNAKYELLNCLISLILGAESLFCPYANMTLYKVLDFLTDQDWLKRKLALNVIYTMIFYCKDEILPLKEHIINFLNVLKNDKIKEVREVSVLILQMFDDNKSIQTISSGKNLNNSGVEHKERENKKKLKNNTISNNYKRVKVAKKANNTNNANINKRSSKISNNTIVTTSPNRFTNKTKTKKSTLVTNLSKRSNNIKNNNKKNNIDKITSKRKLNKELSMTINDKKEKKLLENKIKSKELKKNDSITSYDRSKDRKGNKEKSNERDRSKDRNKNRYRDRSKDKDISKETNNTYRDKIKSREKSRETNRENNKKNEINIKARNRGRTLLSNSLNCSKEGSGIRLEHTKYINRKKDNSFVNQKMIIKPDPNKSIFNSNKNMAFFQQNKNQNEDVIVIPNENRGKYNTYDNFYKSNFNKEENEEEINNDEEEIGQNQKDEIEKENTTNTIEDINKNYDKNINSINELITLDSKIKQDNSIDHIENIINDNNINKNDELNNNIDKKDDNNNINNNINTENNNLNNQNDINNPNGNNNGNNTNLINILLSEVKALSNKQITLLDLMDEIQTNTQQQIEDLNQKIIDLKTDVKDLNHQLYVLQREQS